MTAPLFAHAEGGVLGFIKKVGTRIDSMTIRGVDRRYIEMPEKPWQVILQGNINRSVLEMDALVDASRLERLSRDNPDDDISGDLSWEPRIKTPVSTYVGVWAGYRGYGFGYSKNVGGDDGSIIKFGLIGSSYGATLRIHRFSTKRPTVDAKSSVSERQNVTIEYPLDNPMYVRLMTFDGYYFFNGKRCSYTAAYDQSVIQRRSSGSLMVGAMYYHSTIDYVEDHNADFIYLMNDIGKTKHYQFSLGGGYAYNWVPCKGLLVSGLGLLMVTAYNRLDVWRYNSNFRQYFMGESNTISDIPVVTMDQKSVNQAVRDVLRVWPMEDDAYEKQYSHAIPVIDARLSVTYNVGNWFFNTNAQLHRFSFKYDEDKGSLTDWYVNASVGIRL
jgi:hypothetical protein